MHAVIIGKPNAGKSTLLNAFTGQKWAATSGQAGTTTNQISIQLSQLQLTDTPGWHCIRNNDWSNTLNRTVRNCISEADILLILLDSKNIAQADEKLLELVKFHRKPESKILVVLNKIDLLPKNDMLLPIINSLAPYELDEIIPVSALKKKNLDILQKILLKYTEQYADLSEPQNNQATTIDDVDAQKALCREMVKQSLYRHLQQEVPGSCALRLIKWEEKRDKIDIAGDIITQKEGQKAIIIGHQGAMIKQISQNARIMLSKRLQRPIRLVLQVKVVKEWKQESHLYKI